MRLTLELRGIKASFSRNIPTYPQRILVACDATFGTADEVKRNYRKRRKHMPTSGVNTEFQQITRELPSFGYEVSDINPGQYPHVQLNVFPDAIPSVPLLVKRRIRRENPQTVLVMTPEAPIGFATILACKRLGIPTVAFYTSKVGEIIAHNVNSRLAFVLSPLGKIARREIGLSSHTFDRLFKFIYNRATSITVPTPEMQTRLEAWGVKPEKIHVWDRGIDTQLFCPPKNGEQNPYLQLPWYSNGSKVLIFVGRVQAEKNLEAFLSMDTPGYTKVVVGDGTERKRLAKKYSEAHFVGAKYGEELAGLVKFASGMVQPSKDETFGLSACEAMVSGTPVLSFDVEGLNRSVVQGVTGFRVPSGQSLREDAASLKAGLGKLEGIDRETCAREARKRYSLHESMEGLVRIIGKTQVKN